MCVCVCANKTKIGNVLYLFSTSGETVDGIKALIARHLSEILTSNSNKLHLFYARELFLLLVQNTAVVGATFDVFSYGVVLYEIPTHYLPNDMRMRY